MSEEPVLEVSAPIALGEEGTVVRSAQTTISGRAWPGILIEATGIGLGVGAMTLIAGFLAIVAAIAVPGRALAISEGLSSAHWLLAVVGATVGLKLAQGIEARRRYRGFLDGLRALGTPEALVTHFRIRDDGLKVSTSRVSYAIAWPSILQVFREPRHWVLQSDTISFILPRSAFADEHQERAFLAQILRRLDEDAAARSLFAM